MLLSERQEKILEIIQHHSPITGHCIAGRLHVTRAALRSDLAILTMLGLIDARPKLGYFFTGNQAQDPVVKALSEITVSSCLSQSVVVGADMSIYDAIITLFTEDVGTIFVGDNNVLCGVVSRKDLLKTAMGGNDLHAIPVRLVMTPVSKMLYSTPEEKAVVAAQRLLEYEIDCLPVVHIHTTEDDTQKKELQIVGRISKTNIARVFVECGMGRRT